MGLFDYLLENIVSPSEKISSSSAGKAMASIASSPQDIVDDKFQTPHDNTELVLDPNDTRNNINIMTPDSDYQKNIKYTQPVLPTRAPMQIGEMHPFYNQPLDQSQQDIYEKKLKDLSSGKRQFKQDIKNKESDDIKPEEIDNSDTLDSITDEDNEILSQAPAQISGQQKPIQPFQETPKEKTLLEQINELNYTTPVSVGNPTSETPSLASLVVAKSNQPQKDYNDLDYQKLLLAAMNAERGKKLTSDFSKVGTQIGAAIAGVKPDYTVSDKIGTGEDQSDILNKTLKMREYAKQMKLDNELSDPDSEISKTVQAAYKRAFGQEPPAGFSAKMAEKMGLPMNVIYESERKRIDDQLQFASRKAETERKASENINKFNEKKQELQLRAINLEQDMRKTQAYESNIDNMIKHRANSEAIEKAKLELNVLKEKNENNYKNLKMENDKLKFTNKLNTDEQNRFTQITTKHDEDLASRRTDFGLAKGKVSAAKRALAILNSVKNLDKLNPKQLDALAYEYASMLSISGNPTDTSYKKFTTNNPRKEFAEFMSNVSGKMAGSNFGDYAKYLKNSIVDQQKLAQKEITDHYSKLYKGLKASGASDTLINSLKSYFDYNPENPWEKYTK
jgi:hypothetical protein